MRLDGLRKAKVIIGRMILESSLFAERDAVALHGVQWNDTAGDELYLSDGTPLEIREWTGRTRMHNGFRLEEAVFLIGVDCWRGFLPAPDFRSKHGVSPSEVMCDSPLVLHRIVDSDETSKFGGVVLNEGAAGSRARKRLDDALKNLDWAIGHVVERYDDSCARYASNGDNDFASVWRVISDDLLDKARELARALKYSHDCAATAAQYESYFKGLDDDSFMFHYHRERGGVYGYSRDDLAETQTLLDALDGVFAAASEMPRETRPAGRWLKRLMRMGMKCVKEVVDVKATCCAEYGVHYPKLVKRMNGVLIGLREFDEFLQGVGKACGFDDAVRICERSEKMERYLQFFKERLDESERFPEELDAAWRSLTAREYEDVCDSYRTACKRMVVAIGNLVDCLAPIAETLRDWK